MLGAWSGPGAGGPPRAQGTPGVCAPRDPRLQRARAGGSSPAFSGTLLRASPQNRRQEVRHRFTQKTPRSPSTRARSQFQDWTPSACGRRAGGGGPETAPSPRNVLCAGEAPRAHVGSSPCLHAAVPVCGNEASGAWLRFWELLSVRAVQSGPVPRGGRGQTGAASVVGSPPRWGGLANQRPKNCKGKSGLGDTLGFPLPDSPSRFFLLTLGGVSPFERHRCLSPSALFKILRFREANECVRGSSSRGDRGESSRTCSSGGGTGGPMGGAGLSCSPPPPGGAARSPQARGPGGASEVPGLGPRTAGRRQRGG